MKGRKLIVNMGTLSSGGAERVLSILSTSFADAFDEVHYVLWLDDKCPEIFYKIDSRIKIVRLSKECGKTSVFYKILWFRKYVREQKPSLVLSFMVMVNFAVTFSLFGICVPQVVAERNDPRYFGNKYLRRLIDFLYTNKNVKGILMQTQNNKNYFTSKCLHDKTDVIPNPILMDKSKVGIGLSVNKDELIVSVGRLAKQKRQEDLINAFNEIHRLYPNLKLCIWGEGERRFELENLVETLKLNGRVYFMGRTDNVLDVIAKAKIFVLSSTYEGMSNALLEAMCCGLPCISTKVSGAVDLIKDGKNGLLVEVGDTKSLANRMDLLLSNEDFSKEIAYNATRIYNDLNSVTISKQWVDYLLTKMQCL